MALDSRILVRSSWSALGAALLLAALGAAGMVTNLGPILESDCEDFVFKMWRMLIFEMLNQMP